MINNLVNKITSALEFFGSDQTLDMVQYTLLRDSLDSRYVKGSQSYFSPGELRRKEISDVAVEYVFERAVLALKFILPNVVYVSWSTGNDAKQILDFESSFNGQVKLNTVQEQSSTMIETDRVRIRLMDNGDIVLFNGRDNFLRRDAVPTFGQSGFRQKFEIRREASIMGFGERAFPLNLRGRRLKLWNRDADGRYGPGADPLYVNIPVYLDATPSCMFLTFHENSSEAFFSVCADNENIIEMSFKEGNDRYFVIVGSIQEIYSSYAKITGFPSMPPKWALGFHQSRWGYMSSSQIEEIAAGFLNNDFPISAIHLDIDYMDGFRIFTFDRSRFPDVRVLSSSLLARGIHLVTIIDPGVKWDPDYFMYREGVEGKRFVSTPEGDTLKAPVWPGLSAFPDFSSEDVQKWWGQKYDIMLDNGISGFWHDMNEPAAFVLWGENTLPLSSVHRGGSHISIHNIYGYLMGKAAYEYLSSRPDRDRPFILSRAGFAGQQKYTWFWTGDSESSWEEMKQTVFTTLGMSLSGLPYVGSDTGGFWGDPSAELFTRWFQMASFMPFFRTHSGKTFKPREPWEFGEPYVTILREAAKTRYRLLPYLYSVFYNTHVTGYPVIRPIFWIDSSYVTKTDTTEFILGDSILVAPVTSEGASAVSVNLPGKGWYDFHNPENYHSENNVTVQVTMEKLPVFVKEGSIIPTAVGNDLHLGIYIPRSDSEFSFTMYSDDNKNVGKWRLDVYEAHLTSGSLTLNWSEKGDLPFPYSSITIEIFGGKVASATVDGKEIPVSGNSMTLTSQFAAMDVKMGVSQPP